MGRFKEIDRLMIELIEYGEEQVYRDIETIKCAFTRFRERHMYYLALNKLKEKLKEN